MQDRRIVKTKQAIKKAFLELIKVKPMSKITITEIAEQADLCRKTFYLHYTSVEQILEEIINDQKGFISEKVESYFKKDQEVDVHAIFRDINLTIVKIIKSYHPEEGSESGKKIFIESSTELVKEALKHIIVHYYEATEDFPLYYNYYASGIVSFYATWLNDPTSYDLDSLVEKVELICFTSAEDLFNKKN